MQERSMRVDANESGGIRDVNLYHGLKLASSTLMSGTFAEICYCNETQEYLVLDTGTMVERYSMQGKPIRPSYQLGSTMLFTRMLWCSVAKVLACYIPHDDMIWIVTASCKLLQIVRNEFRIEEMFYSSVANVIIVVGTNKITMYPMHDIEHPLNSLQTLTYLDSNYGSLWRIEYSSLVERSSSILTLAGSYLTTIYIMSLKPENNTEGSSEFLAKKINAMRAAITALYYHQIAEWIITGDQQGNVSGWNLELECIMSCPNAHTDQVRLIIRHPSICGFLTISDDNVLQIWSCNLREKLESFRDIGNIWRIAINDTANSMASLGTKLNCFHINLLYVFYAPLTASATNLYSTTNPTFPRRIIVTSSDNTVRILSSRGRHINVQILSPKLEVIAASYSGISNRMYTIILKTGEILVSSVKTKPMKLRHVWVNDERRITCIVAYESFDKIRAIGDNEKITIKPVSTSIVVGTSDGKLVMIDETSGKHDIVVSAHEDSIVDICSSIISRQVVSVGKDRSVKVWRIYPDITSPLVLMYSVHYVVPITRVASLGFTVCMVSSSEESKSHRIIMYDTSERISLDHHSSKEHSALVTSIATLESLEICASSSIDKTIRVWNQQNELLKILQINTTSRNIIFSSLRGDIVFSAGRHLYRISYENYLSPKYRCRLIDDEIPEEFEDEMISEDVNYRIYDDVVDREKVLHPVSSTPFGSLDTENSDVPKLEVMLLEQISLNRRYREEDILRIKEGKIKGARLVANKAIMSNDTWEKHIADLLDSSTKTIDILATREIWEDAEKYSNVIKAYNVPGVLKLIHGYSVLNFEDYTKDSRDSVECQKIPMYDFMPNSVAYKIQEVKTPKTESEPQVEKRKFKYQYPPEVLLGQVREDSQVDMDVPLTLSQLAELGTGEEMIEE